MKNAPYSILPALIGACLIGGAVFGRDMVKQEVFPPPPEIPALLQTTAPAEALAGIRSIQAPAYLICSRDEERLRQLRRQLQFARKDLSPRLGPLPDVHRLEIWDIDDPMVWNDLLKKLKVHHQGVALHVDNRVFVQPLENGEGRYLGLFHELVHYHFWAKGWTALLPWAEEGSAQFYAWNTAQRYARSQHRELTREQVPVPESLSYAQDWRSLLKVRSCPADPGEARYFYQCSEYLVTAILRRLRIDQHDVLWEDLSGDPTQLETILTRRFRWTEDDWSAMEMDYNRFIENSRT